MSTTEGMSRIPITSAKRGDTLKHGRELRTVATVEALGLFRLAGVRIEWADMTPGTTYSPTARVWAFVA